MISPHEALELLREGNLRFVAEKARLGGGISAETRAELVDGQAPFAAVLGCSDSRVPTEIIFDRGFGDLFVIRVAGNLAGPLEIGSAEFAVGKLGTPLVVVLGHTGCGAVAATLEMLRSETPGDANEPGASPPSNLQGIVEHIRPTVEPLMAAGGHSGDPAAVARAAVRANVRAEVGRLQENSALLRRSAERGELLVVGAEYALETGEVDFFDIPHEGALPTSGRAP